MSKSKITKLLSVMLAFALMLSYTSFMPKAATSNDIGRSVRSFGKDSNGELIIANISVKDKEYGAKGDGITDDTDAFLLALNDLQDAGGGVLYLPEGRYIIDDVLYIPQNVTLIGDWKSPYEGGNGTGTILLAYFGRDYEPGGPSDRPFITMGYASTLKHVSIWYPKQTPDDIKPYPYTISATLAGTVSHIEGVTLYNSWQGIDTTGSMKRIKEVYGTPLKTGVLITKNGEVSEFMDVNFSTDIWGMSTLPNAPTSKNIEKVRAYTREAVGIDFGRIDDALLYDIDINPYDYPVGIHVRYETQTGATGGGGGHAMKLHDTQIKIDPLMTTWWTAEVTLDLTDDLVEGDVPDYELAEPRYPTSTKMFNVMDYGAVGEGSVDSSQREFVNTHDDTAAIRAAIKAAKDAGGGVVVFPAGAYRITDTITVPSNVELRGLFNGPHYITGHNKYISEIWMDFGKGEEDGAPGIILEKNSGLKGLTIRQPNNRIMDYEVGNVPKYPYVIKGNGSGIWVENVTIVNCYRGVDLASEKCDNFLLKYVYMTAMDISFKIGGGSDGGILENTFATYGIWQETDGTRSTEEGITMQEHYAKYAESYHLGNTTNLKAFGIFAFASGKGLWTYKEDGKVPTNITMWRLGLDTPWARPALLLDYGKNINVYGVGTASYLNDPYYGVEEEGHGIIQTENLEGPVKLLGHFIWPDGKVKLLDNGHVTLVKAEKPWDSQRHTQEIPAQNNSKINIDEYPFKPYIIYIDETTSSVVDPEDDLLDKEDSDEPSADNTVSDTVSDTESTTSEPIADDITSSTTSDDETDSATQSTPSSSDADNDTAGSASTPVGLIVGLCVVLGVFLLILVAGVIYYIKKVRKN